MLFHIPLIALIQRGRYCRWRNTKNLCFALMAFFKSRMRSLLSQPASVIAISSVWRTSTVSRGSRNFKGGVEETKGGWWWSWNEYFWIFFHVINMYKPNNHMLYNCLSFVYHFLMFLSCFITIFSIHWNLKGRGYNPPPHPLGSANVNLVALNDIELCNNY